MSGDRGNQFAWRTHEALQGWTASVDGKASIVLVVEVAVAGAAVQSLYGDLDAAGGVHLAAIIATLVALGLSVGCALGVVFPRLARRQAQGSGLLFFGHLRGRTVAEIDKGLAAMAIADEREQLAAQLHIMARVAWRKHTWLQTSIVMLVVGGIGLMLTLALFPRSTDKDPAPEPRRQLVSGGERSVTVEASSHKRSETSRFGNKHPGSLK